MLPNSAKMKVLLLLDWLEASQEYISQRDSMLKKLLHIITRMVSPGKTTQTLRKYLWEKIPWKFVTRIAIFYCPVLLKIASM